MKKIILISAIILAAVYFEFAQNKSVSIEKSVSINNVVEISYNHHDIIETAFNNR
jgi:hypothetical protein